MKRRLDYIGRKGGWQAGGLWLLLLLLIEGTACKKDEDPPGLEDGKSTVIYDLAGDTDASVGDGVEGKEKRPFYSFLFRFKDRKQIWVRSAADSAQYLKTADWDIAFTYIYNSVVYVNNGQRSDSPGYGGPGKGAIVAYDVPYSEVREAPDDRYFEENDLGFAGRDGWPQPGNRGWYFYSLDTHLAIPIKNRTFVLKTAAGYYAKLELLNVYQGNPPAVTDLYWPAPYLTFRYFVQENGSRDLTTKN